MVTLCMQQPPYGETWEIGTIILAIYHYLYRVTQVLITELTGNVSFMFIELISQKLFNPNVRYFY